MNKQLKDLIELYNQGISCTKLAKIYNTTTYKIIKVLKENGCVIVNKQNEKPECINDFIDDYKKGGISIAQLAKKYKLSPTTIAKWIKKEGIEIINNQNRTKFNENIFDKIDTKEKAYWLGFIFADGYISNRDNTFELSLSINDKNHLDKFNCFMQHEFNNVKTDSFRCRWSVVNKHLWNTLNNYGCTSNKSLTLKFPSLDIFEDDHLVIDFIRGYVDGDGSLFFESKTNSSRISVLGTKDFLENINNYLLNDSNKLSSNHGSKETLCLSRGCAKAVAIAYMLYYKSTIYLDRKYLNFLQFQNCRFKVKALKLLEGKIGEGWDMNKELMNDIKNGTIV